MSQPGAHDASGKGADAGQSGSGGQGTGGDSGTGQQNGSQNNQQQQQTSSQTTDNGNNSDTGKWVSKEEYDRVLAQAANADRNRTATSEKNKELEEAAEKWRQHEEAQKTELQKAQDKANKEEQEKQKHSQENNDLRLQNAFLMVKDSPLWHDARDAFDLVKRDYSEEITVEKDGTVKGMDKAVEKLVKAKPHLVKNDQTPGSSGPGHNGKRTGQDNSDTNRENLGKRFPSVFGP